MSTPPSRRTVLQGLGLLALGLASGPTLAACSGPGAGGGVGGADVAELDLQRASMSTDKAAAAPMLGAMAGSLYREVLPSAKGNLIFSPWSIAVAMGMNRAGARATTASQIDSALHFPTQPSTARDEALNTAALVLASYNRTYEQGARKGTVTIRSANSAWARPDIAWEHDYLAALARYYGSGVRLTDFAADPEHARAQINTWVAEHTDDHIKDLVPQGAITPLTALALVNAVFLEAPWAERFEKQATQPGTFTRSDGATTTVPMMHGMVTGATGSTSADHQTVTLPYLGDTLAMTVVLPTKGRERQVAEWLGGTGVTEAIASARAGSGSHPGGVQVTMPKFSFRSTVDLKSVLTSLGITDAFDPDRADYSGMTTTERLFISAALHQATIEVDEEGTVATAATAVVAGTTSLPAEEQVIVLDRPFHLVIHDRTAGIPLFLGHVADPSQTT